MSDPAIKPNRRYTWSDYQTWDDDQRWEVIDGIAYRIPSPTTRHQWVLGNLLAIFADHFRGTPHRAFHGPLDVVLSEMDVVQPDLLVICNPSQVKRTHIEGAPTLVVEIICDAFPHLVRHPKLHLYARSGVQEYWIVTP